MHKLVRNASVFEHFIGGQLAATVDPANVADYVESVTCDDETRTELRAQSKVAPKSTTKRSKKQ